MFNDYELKKGVVLQNKVAIAPMTTWASNDDLTVSDEEVNYYSERAEGFGMVITGCTFFKPNGQSFSNQFYAGTDEFIPSLEKLATAIKSKGTKAVLQIFHGGRLGDPNSEGGHVAPSAVKPLYSFYEDPEKITTPRELKHEEILDIIDGFYQTTRRAIQAGFDGIEIHGANGFLVQQFFSPHANRRTDEWGGSIENRMKFPLAVIEAVNKAKDEFADDKFIIGYRFSPEELENPGITLDDTLQLIDVLADQRLDYIQTSLKNYKMTSIRDVDDKRIVGKVIAEKINGRVALIGVGEITKKEDIADALENVGYDMVSVGKAIVTDTRWIAKIQAGEKTIDYLDMNNLDKQNVPPLMANALKAIQAFLGIKIKE